MNLILRNNGIIQNWIQDAAVLSVENGDFYGTGRTISADLKMILFDQQWLMEQSLLIETKTEWLK